MDIKTLFREDTNQGGGGPKAVVRVSTNHGFIYSNPRKRLSPVR
jgi:hypothetical protein